ncbi:MAG: cation diffusion facilitator family transporter [Bdellovibrionota bacterium]
MSANSDAVIRAQRLAALGMLFSFILGFLKLIAGLIGHSYALVADAIESFTDILASAVVWGGLQISSRPASERHPYGYGKAESLAAAAVAAMIFAAGIGIGIEAIHEILTPHHAPQPFTLAVLLVVVGVKEILYRVTHRTGKEIDSTAVTTDAWHHRSDALTSLVAFVGISVALIGGPGWEPADDWAALCAAAVILYNAVSLLIAPIRELLDVQSENLAEQARELASSVPSVAHVEKVFTRKSGRTYWIDMHLWVDGDMNIRDAHSLAHQVKDVIRGQMPSVQDVLIHLEPAEDPHRTSR